MKIAIIDDDAACRKQVEEFCREYGRASGQTAEVCAWSLGINFVEEYKADCDVIFLDVEMPHMDGIETAKKIRETDPEVPIIFLTSFSQYAINGYEVNALDYVMKPLTYFVFEKKLQKVLAFSHRREKENVVIFSKKDVIRIPLREIRYVDSEGNNVVYHTERGTFRERMTMRETAKKLDMPGMFACSSGCIVNLAYVTRVEKDVIFLGEERLPVSRAKKKEFMERYIQFLSGR